MNSLVSALPLKRPRKVTCLHPLAFAVLYTSIASFLHLVLNVRYCFVERNGKEKT